MKMNDEVGATSDFSRSQRSDPTPRTETISYFILTVLGFSFWFFMVVPFATHRESYSWLAAVGSQNFASAFSFISVTYRPLAQGTAWLGFRILDPSIFPTSVLRQALLQGFMYGMFVLSWWLIYLAAPLRRLFALVAFLTGGVFFSGYIHLFHIYGIFYVPVLLILGALLLSHAAGKLAKQEVWFALAATVLALWHPFATALFAGAYFGFYLDTFGQRRRAEHVQAIVILLMSALAIAALVLLFPRADAVVPLHDRLFGFLVSYQTNEINPIASVVAFVLALTVVFSMPLSPKVKLAAILLVSALSVVFLLKALPLLFLWLCAVLVKLLRMRCWTLFFLTLAAALFPFGGIIGAPVFALFALIVAVYVTALGWLPAEKALSRLETRYVMGTIAASAIILLLVRVGINVPIVTRLGSPLLIERERTYQLEGILAWLHRSDYCGCNVAFTDNAGSPTDSVKSAMTRRNRPPAGIEDVQYFWNTALRCQNGRPSKGEARTAVVTFGVPALANFQPIFKLGGRFAGDATVWIADSQR